MTYVFLGADLRDAQAIAVARRDEFRGKDARIVSVSTLHGLQGLAVSGWCASERALAHPNAERALEALRASEIKTDRRENQDP
jgi:hypothetical protein